MLNRRHFLAGCAGTAALAPLATFLSSEWERASRPVLTPARDTFAALIGQPFDVCDPQSDVPLARLTLAAVDDSPFSSAQVEQFALRFDGAAGAALIGDVYTLRHGTAGNTDVRLEPLAGRDGAARYRAAFALLRDPARSQVNTAS